MSLDGVTVEIRAARASDRDAVLAFIEAFGFNPRDTTTWDALDMTAMTAWAGETLLGAIPLEPRSLVIAPGIAVPAVHETVVAVHPDYQGEGLGSRLQDAIHRDPPGEAVIATVYREEPESGAYRWYQKNGFTPWMHIDSWFLDEPGTESSSKLAVLESGDTSLNEDARAALFAQAADGRAGYVDRRTRRLLPWLAVHPYRHRYEFRFAQLHDDGVAATALLGIGTLHSDTTRVEILELAARADDPDIVAELVRGIVGFAHEHGYRPVRWTLSRHDPLVAVAKAAGFESRWSFDLMGRVLRPDVLTVPTPDPNGDDRFRYHGIDYI